MPRITFSPERLSILWHLASHEIYELYHSTPFKNLRQIFRTRAVCSYDMLAKKNWLKHVEFGGDELSHRLDVELGNTAYVSLSYTPRTPMSYRREIDRQICYLVFDASIATRKGVVFIDGNAASKNSEWETGMKGLRLVNFDAVKRKSAYSGTTDHRDRQAEMLVPEQIRTKDILYVAFRSQASLDEARRLCSGLRDLPSFRIEPNCFNLGKKDVFGCVNAVLLNRRQIRRDVTGRLTEEQLKRLLAKPSVEGKLAKQERGISLVQRIAAVPYLQLTVKWYGPGRTRVIMKGVEEPEKPFRTHEHYDVCTTLGPEHLKPGPWRVESELSLNDHCVHQFTMNFDVVARGTQDDGEEQE